MIVSDTLPAHTHTHTHAYGEVDCPCRWKCVCVVFITVDVCDWCVYVCVCLCLYDAYCVRKRETGKKRKVHDDTGITTDLHIPFTWCFVTQTVTFFGCTVIL